MEYYAHSSKTGPWQILEDHLQKVSTKSSQFAKEFNSSEWAMLAGYWHDIGKYSNQFQSYLSVVGNAKDGQIINVEKVDHSTSGARFSISKLGQIGLPLAYSIAGHHGGLPNYNQINGTGGLVDRLDEKKKKIPDIDGKIPTKLYFSPDIKSLISSLPRKNGQSKNMASFRLSFWTRMLFSTLVDSDFLMTESFMSPNKTYVRKSKNISIKSLQTEIIKYIQDKSKNSPNTIVNEVRRSVYQKCLQSANNNKGFFSLNVPTGGGKTLSGMAFALKHARVNNMRRVIFGIPFTSIIQQTSDVYRQVFDKIDKQCVLQHHCNLDPDQQTFKCKLLCQNWDAPIIVTSNVQLLQSLFSNKTSRCRKLHRVVNSVIVLDQAQSIPLDMIQPCLACLKVLVQSFGCSVVICSATQPAIEYRNNFTIGIQNIKQIIPKQLQLAKKLNRTKTVFIGEKTDDFITSQLLHNDQALCIVNSKKHAEKLFNKVINKTKQKDSIFHLSTRMCAKHRSQTLSKIKIRLKNKQKCIVISTQLIQAGVDVDFPVCYRSLAGVQSIIQSGGRCNRQGSPQIGLVYIFIPQQPIKFGYLKQTADTTLQILKTHLNDITSDQAVYDYFQLLFWKNRNNFDKKKVMQCFKMNASNFFFQFKDCNERFKLIQEIGTPVLIPFDNDGVHISNALINGSIPDKNMMRKMQRRTVQVLQKNLTSMIASGKIVKTDSEILVLIDPMCYDNNLGIILS